MTLAQLAETYGLPKFLLTGSLLQFQAYPSEDGVGISYGFKSTGLKAGATPSKRIGIIETATGAVLYEWDGNRASLRLPQDL